MSCCHIKKCKNRQEHIAALERDLLSAPSWQNAALGELTKSDYRFVIKYEREKLRVENNAPNVELTGRGPGS